MLDLQRGDPLWNASFFSLFIGPRPAPVAVCRSACEKKGYVMPKMKTNSGAKKRFKRTASGRLKREKAFKSHILTKKSRKRKRSLGQSTLVEKTDETRMNRLLGGK